MWNQNNKTWFDFTLNCGWQIYIWTSYIGEQWDPARHSALYKSSRSCLVDTPLYNFVRKSVKKHESLMAKMNTNSFLHEIARVWQISELIRSLASNWKGGQVEPLRLCFKIFSSILVRSKQYTLSEYSNRF